MPIILRIKGYKFWFYEADLGEPPHVHVGKGGKTAKFWLNPMQVERTGKFKPIELREIERIIDENLDFLLKAWEKEKSKHVDR
jgi:hypothetical protein